MSKIDQLRRQREEQHDRQVEQLRAPGPGSRAKSAPVAAPAPAPAPVLAARRAKVATEALEGSCSVCGKMRALNNGLVSNHQKGLGKMCPGSRKEPA